MADTEKIFPTSIRLPQSLKKDLETIAKNEDRSVNGQIVRMLRDAVGDYKKEHPDCV